MQQSYADVVKRSEQVFGLMREIVEGSPGRVARNKTDFYLHDRHYLRNTLAMGQYIWSVEDSGTELRTIGISEKNHEWMRAVMNAYSSRDLYLIDATKLSIKPISDAQALDLMRATRYDVKHGIVSRLDIAFASVSVELFRQTAYTKSDSCNVRFESIAGQPVRDEDLVALADVAMSQAIKASGTLMVALNKVTIDDRDLFSEFGPKFPELTSAVTWYGTINASVDETRFLESLKVVLGKYDPVSGSFPVKVSEAAYNELKQYADSFKFDLAPLPHAFKPEGELELGKALNRITADRLSAYESFLAFEAATATEGQPDRQAVLQTAQEAVSAEISRRAVKAVQARDRELGATQPSVAHA